MTSSAVRSTESLAISEVPLCVDLDGTLVCSNTMIEEISIAARKKPFHLLRACLKLFWGRAEFKQSLASLRLLDVSNLPYRQSLLELIHRERAKGRRIMLVTGAHQRTAEAIAQHVRCFDTILSTCDGENLTGKAKRERLLECCPGGFYYAGNSQSDLPVWQSSVGAILVGASIRVQRSAARCGINIVLTLK